MDIRTIVSIYPRECRHVKSLFTPTTTFILPAAEKGKYTTLRIEPQVQGVYVGRDNAGAQMHMPRQITVDEVANDCVRVWTMGSGWQGMPENAAPGIWKADEPEPTPEQILNSTQYKVAFDLQNKFFEAKVRRADDFDRRNQRYNINEEYLVAADWIGVTGRPWQEELKAENSKLCQWCGRNIPSGALKCAYCQEVVDYERYAQEQKKLQAQARPLSSLADSLSGTT
jgi:predicted nucleic acid-binding Zn ribbon protein